VMTAHTDAGSGSHALTSSSYLLRTYLSLGRVARHLSAAPFLAIKQAD